MDGTTSPQDLIYTVTPTSADNCVGETFTITITVNPTPTMVQPSDIEVCNGDENIVIDFTTANTAGVTTYSWSATGPEIGLPDSTTDITDSTADITFTANNPDPEPRVVTIEVTPIFTNDGVTCTTEDSQTFTITVNPEPQITNFTETICEGDTFTDITPLDNTDGVVPAGTTYTWVIAGTSSASIEGASASTVASATITGSQLTLVDGTTSPQDLIYTVTPTSADNCVGETFTITITVNPSAQLDSIEDVVLCDGVESLPITFTTSNIGGNTSYTWEVITTESDEIGLIENQGTGNIPSFIPINSGLDQLEALIEVTPLFTNDDSECAGISELFKIIVIPSADVIQPEDITVCNGELVSVIFETNNLVGLTTYSWTSSIDIGAGLFDDGNILFNAVNEPNQNTISTLITVTAQIDNLGVICDGPTQTFTINVNGNVDAKPTISNYNGFEISCFDANDGFINLNPEGGSPFTNDPKYIYSWIGPNGFTSNEQNISNLVSGTYDLIITDSLGCNFEFQYLINEPDQLEIIVDNETDILCNGVLSGEILITPAGGTGSYLYEWTKDGLPYSELQDLVGLSAGTYVLFLYDSNDCGPVSEIFEITEPTAIESDIDLLVDILCFGDATGSIDLTISGGTPFILPSGDFEYTYNWIGPNGFSANTEDIVNLIAGIYTLTVTDNVGCQMIFEYELTQPEDLIINYTSTNNSCYESDDGTISLEITGGVEPYNIAWSNLGNGPIQTNLSAGDYEVIVTDFHDCVESIIINIVEAPLFDIDPVSNDISCFGANDGYINLNISGGVPPMTVTWDDDLTAGVERNNLSAGTYTVLIVDSSGNNCSITQSFVILEPQELSLSSIIENAIDCEVINSGSIDLQVVGGSPPYSFQWNNGSTQEDLFNIAPGNYSVSVIDSRDCEIVENFAVERQEDITTSLDITFEADCENDIPYQITTINVEGGVAPYEIIWSSGEVSGDNNEIMTSSQNGTVIVDIVDFLGCESQVVFDIDLFELGSPGFNYSSPGLTECETLGVGDLIQFTNTSTGDYISVDWNFGDTGLTVINEENPTHIYNQPGTYVVTQTVYYEYGCVDVFEDILYVTIGYGLVLPNAFTPNGDGINDTIRPWFKCMTNVEISIYDTFGSLLYVEAGEEIYGWDGSINGKMAENGNYIIVVRATTLFGEIIDLNGPITLIR